MKKISLALAVTSALGASAANAAIVGEYGNALLVPWVTARPTNAGEINGTSVSLTSCAAGTVYWSYYNTASVKLIDSQFPMTKNDQRSIIWNDTEFGNGGFLDQNGYMIFFLDTTGDGSLDLNDSTCLAGNAFYVDTVANDVAFVPTFPMNVAWEDFGSGADAGVPNLIDVPAAEITGLWAGAQYFDTIHMRYFVDSPVNPADGTDNTEIFVWTANRIGGARTIQQYDNTQSRFSLTLFLDNLELHILNPETNNNFSVISPYPDGFYEWTLDDAADLPAFNAQGELTRPGFGGLATWSVVNSPRFQATQTLINPIFKPHIADGSGTVETTNMTRERFSILERYNPEGDRQDDGVGDAYGMGMNGTLANPSPEPGIGSGNPCLVIHTGEECPTGQ